MSATDQQQSRPDSGVSRERFLKGGATVAATILGGSALAAGADRVSAATNKAHFNITGRAQATITFAAWGTPNAAQQFQPTMNKFMAQNPNIKVNLIVIPNNGWTALFEVILSRMAAGNAPDILRIAIEGMALFGAKDLALPIDDFMKKDTAYVEDLKNDTLPAMWKALSYKGKQLALPFSYNNMILWYNTNLMKQIGITRPKDDWSEDDFMTACAKLKKLGYYGMEQWSSGTFGLECWSLSAGTNLLSPDWTKSNALAPGNLTAWKLFNDMVNTYKYSPKPNATIALGTLFSTGKVGFVPAGRWPLQTFEMNKFCTPTNCPTDIQYFPILGKGPRKVIFGIDGYPIIKTTKYPQETWELAKFLSTREVMTDWMKQGTNVPCRKSLAYASWMNPPAHYRIFFDSLLGPAATPVSAPPQYNEMDTAITKWYTEMLAQSVTPQAALAGLDKDLTSILAKPA